ncbi:hypothetical protein FOL47_006802 [Perkinsus chesapeaki]|uniref:Uncharacterized protein n=1 Tax=Perkinsus chesapeaki TaxID=330153 RepID=A0A7J6LPC5_PERCH|nr:hypothetical protein FOL47_006802 [Perkinsus chesapeaki]
MSRRLMEVRDRYKQIRRNAEGGQEANAVEAPPPAHEPALHHQSQADTSVEIIENPLPRLRRRSHGAYNCDDSFADSVSTTNILNPPVQAYGKGLGTVTASIEVLGHRDLLRASTDSNGEAYEEIIYGHLRRTRQTLPSSTASLPSRVEEDGPSLSMSSTEVSATASLATSEVLQPPLWFIEYQERCISNIATSPNVAVPVTDSSGSPSDSFDDDVSASLETIRLSPEAPETRPSDTVVISRTGWAIPSEQSTPLDSAVTRVVTISKDVQEQSKAPADNAVPIPVSNHSEQKCAAVTESTETPYEVNLIDLTIDEDDALSPRSINQTLNQSQMSEVSFGNRTFVGSGTLASEMGISESTQRLGIDPLRLIKQHGRTTKCGVVKRGGPLTELPGVSEMTGLTQATTERGNHTVCGIGGRQQSRVDKSIQTRLQLRENATQVEELLLAPVEQETSPEPDSVLPEHLRDRLLKQLYEKCCRSPLRLAKLLREFDGEKSMSATDGELLRQSIGVESDVGRRQFCSVVAAMVRRSCNGLVSESGSGLGAGLQIRFEELLARHRVTIAGECSWVSLMRKAVGGLKCKETGEQLMTALDAMMAGAVRRRTATTGAQTRGFRQTVEESAVYGELLRKYEMKAGRVDVLERQLAKATTVMGASREGTVKERELSCKLTAVQKERDKLAEELSRTETQMSSVEARLDEATHQCASLERELGQVRQERDEARDALHDREAVSGSSPPVAIHHSSSITDAMTQRESNDYVCKLLKAEGWSLGKLPSKSGLLSRQPVPHRRVFRILSTGYACCQSDCGLGSPSGSWEIVWEEPGADRPRRDRVVQIADIIRVEFGETSQCFRRLAAVKSSARPVGQSSKEYAEASCLLCVTLVCRQGAPRASLDLIMPNRNAFDVWILGVNELCDYSNRLKSLTRETFMLYKALSEEDAGGESDVQAGKMFSFNKDRWREKIRKKAYEGHVLLGVAGIFLVGFLITNGIGMMSTKSNRQKLDEHMVMLRSQWGDYEAKMAKYREKNNVGRKKKLRTPAVEGDD